MRRSLLLNLIVAGAVLLICLGGLAMAQGQNPQNPPQTTPMPQPPGSNPRATNPADRPNYPNGTMPEAQFKMDDKKFVKDALMGNMFEVELGKLAVEKASNDGVKQFGQKMIDDHTKANEELKQIAGKEGIPVPESLDSKHQSRVAKLSKLSGADFDKAYIKDQLKDHQQDVKEFQSEAQSGSDTDVKSYASKTLPTLQEHLSMIKELDKGKKATAMK